MSYEDAPKNSERAETLRKFAALQRATSNYGDTVTTMTGTADGYEGEITATLDVDLLLSAANALDALGIPGYAAARLVIDAHTGDETLADVALEAADTAQDTLGQIRAHDPETVQAVIDELTNQ